MIPSTTFVSCAIADCCCAKFVMENNVETKQGKVKYVHNGFLYIFYKKQAMEVRKCGDVKEKISNAKLVYI